MAAERPATPLPSTRTSTAMVNSTSGWATTERPAGVGVVVGSDSQAESTGAAARPTEPRPASLKNVRRCMGCLS